jgi:hypothetical protein
MVPVTVVSSVINVTFEIKKRPLHHRLLSHASIFGHAACINTAEKTLKAANNPDGWANPSVCEVLHAPPGEY